MCGICNIVRCITGRRNGRDCRTYESEYDRRAAWREPCMKIHCASGLGTQSDLPCGMDDDFDCCGHHHKDCGCKEKHPCGPKHDCGC